VTQELRFPTKPTPIAERAQPDFEVIVGACEGYSRSLRLTERLSSFCAAGHQLSALTREAGELDPNVDPTVAFVAIHALVVGHALFRAQFARELWIEPDDLDDRLAMVATRLFVLSMRCAGSPRLGSTQ
jgi:hypothetical protein